MPRIRPGSFTPYSFLLLALTLACAHLPQESREDEERGLVTSHLFVGVTDTEATLRFWVDGLGAVLESDDELADAALDAMMDREGVRIRHTFIALGGTRLHTVEPLDASLPRTTATRGVGIGGVSFLVPDLDRAHEEATAKGLGPTPIYAFSYADPPTRMFFLADPDGVRVEMIEDERSAEMR